MKFKDQGNSMNIYEIARIEDIKVERSQLTFDITKRVKE